jgi:hypothetical protein
MASAVFGSSTNGELTLQAGVLLFTSALTVWAISSSIASVGAIFRLADLKFTHLTSPSCVTNAIAVWPGVVCNAMTGAVNLVRAQLKFTTITNPTPLGRLHVEVTSTGAVWFVA